MCLIVAIKRGQKMPSREKLETAFIRNPDGVGYCYLNNSIKVHKFLDFEKFYRSISKKFNAFGSKSNFIVHFRYATHGIGGLFNVHPFKVSDNVAVAHNGIFHLVKDDVKLSDTRIFIRDHLKPKLKNFALSDRIKIHLKKHVKGSKLAFLTSSNELVIWNENKGHWHGGVWYSNHSYKPSIRHAWMVDDYDYVEQCHLCGLVYRKISHKKGLNTRFKKICIECHAQLRGWAT